MLKPMGFGNHSPCFDPMGLPKTAPRGPWALSLLFLLVFYSCGDSGESARIQAGSLNISVAGDGTIASFMDLDSGSEYLPPGVPAPVLTLRSEAGDLFPVSATLHEDESLLTLSYEGGVEAQVRIQERVTHVTLELVGVTDPSAFEAALWGPYPTTIQETIGETVGVVRGVEFAMGIQALNPKTLGGYPWNENDAMPQLDIFESGDYSDLSEEGKRYVLYRVEAAKPDTFGSTLQAYTRNRQQERVIQNWGHDRYTAPPFDDGGILGSKIALFGAPVGNALQTVGAIEVAEGLPHPTMDGEWGKTARSASAAYVILPFSETTIGEAVDVTLRAGLRYLYHPEPFKTWGHFHLGPDFPNGVEGLRGAVEEAEARGVRVGVHTLSNFITTNDPYVTPVPDPRLARVGTTMLTEDLAGMDQEIGIESPDFFNQFDNNTLRAAVVGNEIVRYGSVSEASPWRLQDVERGAFGTRPEAHLAGDIIGKLADHAYRVFLTNPELSQEMAGTLADLFNATGLRQISFDGLEGNRSTGMGNYGEVLFTSAWYDGLDDTIKEHFVADASRTAHYFWHIYSRMNWGEPWYAGFRESQTEYRLKNQAYFRRNMMPGMLGWFRMQPETSVEDIEWMLARSAAFDAGFAFVTSFQAVGENGRSDEILRLIGMWEEARMMDVFSPGQKARMEDISNEFHLEEVDGMGWNLFQIYPQVFRYEVRERQTGEPGFQAFSFQNPAGEQPLRFILTAEEAWVEGVIMELDGVNRLEIPVRLEDGEALVYSGGDEVWVYSPQWKRIGSVPLEGDVLAVGSGAHTLTIGSGGTGRSGAEGGSGGSGNEGALKVELRLWGEAEFVGR